MLFVTILFISQIIKFELLTDNKGLLGNALAEKEATISITVEENSDFFFGLISGNKQWVQTIMISLQVILMTTLLVITLYSQNFLTQLLLATVLIGGLGNVINRIWNDGKIVDYIKIYLANNYINFNLEDLLILGGASGLMIVVAIKILDQKRRW